MYRNLPSPAVVLYIYTDVFRIIHSAAINRNHHRRNNAKKAREIQASYQSNRTKCIEDLLSPSPPPRCNISKDRLEGYFNVEPTLTTGEAPPPDWLPDNSSLAPTSSDLTEQVV